MEEIKRLQYKTKANDVDGEKGIVTVAVNGIGVKDSQGDISMSGSFNKTLKENFDKIKWFLNHDTKLLLGCPISGEEKDGNLVMTGQINLEKQIGRDILSDYKLYAEHGKTLEHSIGVRAIKRDKVDQAKVHEWKMYEYSTLTSWGSNPQTFLVNIKSATEDQVREAVDFIKKAFQIRGYSDERLNGYNMQLDLLLKALNGSNIVTCPCCGHQFDYDAQQEVSYSQQVIDMAANYLRWMTEDVVREEMDKLEPEVREGVVAIIDSVKVEDGKLTEKALEDIMAYVRCPHCWSRVYKVRNLVVQQGEEGSTTKEEPSDDTLGKKGGEEKPTDAKDKAADSTSFFSRLNDCFSNND